MSAHTPSMPLSARGDWYSKLKCQSCGAILKTKVCYLCGYSNAKCIVCGNRALYDGIYYQCIKCEHRSTECRV